MTDTITTDRHPEFARSVEIERLISSTVDEYNADCDRFDDLDPLTACMMSDEQLVWWLYEHDADDDLTVTAWILDPVPVRDRYDDTLDADALMPLALAQLNYWRRLTDRGNPTADQLRWLRRTECLVAALTMQRQDAALRSLRLAGAAHADMGW